MMRVSGKLKEGKNSPQGIRHPKPIEKQQSMITSVLSGLFEGNFLNSATKDSVQERGRATQDDTHEKTSNNDSVNNINSIADFNGNSQL